LQKESYHPFPITFIALGKSCDTLFALYKSEIYVKSSISLRNKTIVHN